MFSINGGIYRICQWITRLVYLNLLWYAFTLLGLVIFGIGPATTALFAVERKWVLGEADETPVFKTFWSSYKKEFFRGNILGVGAIIVALIMYIDLYFARIVPGLFRLAFLTVFLMILFIYIFTLSYLFPVFVHYKLDKISQYVKNAMLIGFSRLFSSFAMVLLIVVILYIYHGLPFLVPLAGTSLLGLLISWHAHRTFDKIELIKLRIHGESFVKSEKA